MLGIFGKSQREAMINDCKALADQVCRSCWGPASRTSHSLETHCREVVDHRNRSSLGRTHMAAVDSTLAVTGSIPAQRNKLAADSSRPVEVQNRPVVGQIRRSRPVPTPNRRPRANPSHRRASRHHRATQPGRWRGTRPLPERQQLVGGQPACVRRSWCDTPGKKL